MAAFVDRIRPGVTTIIHRDRDFMSDGEILRLIQKYRLGNTPNIKLFITEGSDIEAYFARPEHVAASTGIPLADARVMVETVIQEHQNEFVFRFNSKREEVKRDLYKADPGACPKPADLLPGNQVPLQAAVGKLLLKRLGPKLQALGKNPSLLLRDSDALVDPKFQALA
jgi:hypothetical protein